LGANGITLATSTYFLIAFVTTLWEIFLEYSWNIFEKCIFLNFKFSSYHFIKVYVKNLAKHVIFKKIHIHLQGLLLLKTNVTMFNECFLFIFYSLD